MLTNRLSLNVTEHLLFTYDASNAKKHKAVLDTATMIIHAFQKNKKQITKLFVLKVEVFKSN